MLFRSELDMGNYWVLLLARKGLKLTLIKSKQLKKFQHRELKIKLEGVVPQNFPSHFINISPHKALGTQDQARVCSAQDISLH